MAYVSNRDEDEVPGSDSEEQLDSKSQKRIIVLLWIVIVAVIVLGGVLLYAKYNWLFESPGQSTPVPPGPPVSMIHLHATLRLDQWGNLPVVS